MREYVNTITAQARNNVTYAGTVNNLTPRQIVMPIHKHFSQSNINLQNKNNNSNSTDMGEIKQLII